MFKGRFGDFYLLKVWALTVFVGPILSTFLSFIFFNKGEKLNEELFVFILLHSFLCVYFLKNNIQQFRSSASGMGSLPQISLPVTEDFLIPIPPLKEQERIVAILDKFDTLTTSINEGLPAEIEARKQQYEYYRDALLSFPKSNAVSE